MANARSSKGSNDSKDNKSEKVEEVTTAAIMTARCAAIRPRLMKLRPTSSSTALVPFSVALICRESRVLWQNLHHAAGLVERRFTRKKHSPNMKIVNSASAAMEAGSGNTVGLSG